MVKCQQVSWYNFNMEVILLFAFSHCVVPWCKAQPVCMWRKSSRESPRMGVCLGLLYNKTLWRQNTQGKSANWLTTKNKGRLVKALWPSHCTRMHYILRQLCPVQCSDDPFREWPHQVSHGLFFKGPLLCNVSCVTANRCVSSSLFWHPTQDHKTGAPKIKYPVDREIFNKKQCMFTFFVSLHCIADVNQINEFAILQQGDLKDNFKFQSRTLLDSVVLKRYW